MNVLLSVVQVLLAMLSIAGGAYKVLMYDQLAKMPAAAALPRCRAPDGPPSASSKWCAVYC